MRPFAQSAKRRFSFRDRRFFAQTRRGWMRMSERDGCAPLGGAPNMQEVPARRNACACSLWSDGFAISSSGGGRCAFAMAQPPWSGFRGDAVSHPRAANGALDTCACSVGRRGKWAQKMLPRTGREAFFARRTAAVRQGAGPGDVPVRGRQMRATPLSRAACATALATALRTRGSNGAGMM